MAAVVPATPGARLMEDCDTPALCLDLDAFERNARRMRDAARKLGTSVRPHAKAHKSSDIAKLQLRLLGIADGRRIATGLCAQTVTEAECLVWGGLKASQCKLDPGVKAPGFKSSTYK